MKIVISHQNTDFDGLASMLAVRKLTGAHELVLSSAISLSVQRYLALHKDWLRVFRPQELPEAVTEVVLVDGRDQRRFRQFKEILEGAETIRIYDHHPPGEADITGDVEIVEPVGACVTILAELLEEEEAALSPREATLMLLGLYADTGNLSYESTTVRDVRAAAYLLSQGAMLPLVNRYLQQEYTAGQKRLLVNLMENAEVIERQGLEIGCAVASTEAYLKGASVAVERALQLLGLDACFAVLEAEAAPSVQVIGRSRNGHVDASEVARVFGGGGHPSAASASVKKGVAAEVFEELRRVLRELAVTPLEVRDVMTTPVQSIPPETTLQELRELLQRWCVTGVPVVHDGELIGVVSRRDGQQLAKRGDWHVPVKGFMSHHVTSVGPTESLEEALELMTEKDIGRLPVVEEGRLIGILTRSDALRRLYGDQEVSRTCG